MGDSAIGGVISSVAQVSHHTRGVSAVGVANPVLGAVPDVQNLDRGFLYAVDGDVWQGEKNQFPGAFFAPDTATPRKTDQLLEALKDNANGFPCSFRFVFSNAETDLFEVGTGLRSPSDIHQGCKRRSIRAFTSWWFISSPRSACS